MRKNHFSVILIITGLSISIFSILADVIGLGGGYFEIGWKQIAGFLLGLAVLLFAIVIQKTDNVLKKVRSDLFAFLRGYWPLIIFFLILVWLHSYLNLTHDDYGYATLSYIGDVGESVVGHQFSPAQMVSFLKTHYFSWGGRMVSFVSLLSVLRWDVWVFRIIQPVIITMILFFSMKLIEEHTSEKKTIVTAIFLAALYFLIPIKIHQHGTYWITASSGYVWPFLWIFFAGYLLTRYVKCSLSKIWLIPLAFLFWGIGFSQEQVFFVAFSMIIGILVVHIRHNQGIRNYAVDIFCLIMLLAGYLMLMLAPGNLLRAERPRYADFYALSLPERVLTNLPGFLNATFGAHMYVFYIFMILTSLVFIVKLLRQNSKRPFLQILFAIHSAYLLLLTIVYFYQVLFPVQKGSTSFSQWMNSTFFNTPLFWLILLVSLVCAYWVYYPYKKSVVLISIFIGGVIAQLTGFVIPEITDRTTLIFLFSLFPLFSYTLLQVLEGSGRSKLRTIIISILVILASINSISIFNGYRANSHIHLANSQTLEKASLDIKQGKTIQEIHLLKLADDQYSGAMPYWNGCGYITRWLREYYDIPASVDLIWQ